MLIIGSTALKHHFPDLKRTPNDLDYVVDDSSKYPKEKGIEYLENPILLKYESNGYISPNMLLSLKISHMFWDFKWERHMYDIHFLLKKGCVYDVNIINEFIEYWKEIKPKIRRSNLEMSKENFFTNAVNEDTNQHDYLHTLIADIPAYTKILKDGCEVELDENKWNNLTFNEKCDVVNEETYVMAYERYKKTNYKVAFAKQLKDNIIKHFPFYIALFAIENYPKLEMVKFDYITKIKEKYELSKN